ncbi:hypothetical protein D3C86_2089640 [compost metagenome]
MGEGAGGLVLGEVLVEQGGDGLVRGAEEQHALLRAQRLVDPVEEAIEEVVFAEGVDQGEEGGGGQPAGGRCGHVCALVRQRCPECRQV